MANLFFTVLTLTAALIFTKYITYYIVYFFSKFVKFVSKGKINITIYPITFGDVLSTAMMCLLLSSIFKSVGII